MASKLLLHRCISIILVLATLSMLVFHAQARTPSVNGLSMQARHEAWMAEYGRIYKNATEKEMRYKIFKANVEFIESSNALARPYKLGLNKFSDLTNEEFRSIYNGNNKETFFPTNETLSSKPYWKASSNQDGVPSSMDWRKRGAVTLVKDQGQCGACWAFTAVAAIEGIVQISTRKLRSLSEQELLDCNYYDGGCDGGSAVHAYQYLIKNNKGLTLEAIYPYHAAEGTCNTRLSSYNAVHIRGYYLVAPNREDELLMAVASQPVGVAVDASCQQFQYYKEGVLTESCGTNLNHEITLVGYGTDYDGTNYWIAKNSWGIYWGELGYIKLQRGYADPQGICGLAMNPSFPVA